ncbi:DNA-binding GntR family transcriptional regulator [Motilibacter rhizosphaerae]|uniref:DNA-binding GntR family transcriptional regulator n=1 Tax=Motilibacter rhizosphaerae TaxID=598652 RepID=A0A4Q7NWK2_9ACTN|nr:GntR family transcriptional regulator [Motilibacter rhizosphaerae]RZS91696.1 DNA-binding GntR family transcriptional regulator [Motilibacter rhizosphaerae]
MAPANVDATPLRDVIAEQVRDRIISGDLLPGHRLREEDLAGEYNASRLPVREALARLVSEGFVEVTKFRGASVAVPSVSAGLELVRVRQSLEGLAAELAADRRGGEGAHEISEVLRRGQEAVRRRRFDDLPPLVESFHGLLAAASGNRELELLLEQVRVKMRWVFRSNLPERAADCWAEHAEILSAVLAGFPGLARELMERHVGADAAAYVALPRDAEG